MGIEHRGFASMDKEKQRIISVAGGKAAHAKGKAHQYTSEEAKLAGAKGGSMLASRPGHMAKIGRIGGRKVMGRKSAILRLDHNQSAEVNKAAFMERLLVAGWKQQEADREWEKIQFEPNV